MDVERERLLVFAEPVDGTYRQHRFVERPGRMQLSAMPALEVDLSAVLPLT